MTPYRSARIIDRVSRERRSPVVVWLVAFTIPTLLWGVLFAYLEMKRRPIAALCDRPSVCPLTIVSARLRGASDTPPRP